MLRGYADGAAVVLFSMLSALNTAAAQGRGNLAQDRDAVANGWQFDYDAAKAAALRANKPLMVVFRCVP
jgi:hypothetical protein